MRNRAEIEPRIHLVEQFLYRNLKVFSGRVKITCLCSVSTGVPSLNSKKGSYLLGLLRAAHIYISLSRSMNAVINISLRCESHNWIYEMWNVIARHPLNKEYRILLNKKGRGFGEVLKRYKFVLSLRRTYP